LTFENKYTLQKEILNEIATIMTHAMHVLKLGEVVLVKVKRTITDVHFKFSRIEFINKFNYWMTKEE
jgi:hypothetical protein